MLLRESILSLNLNIGGAASGQFGDMPAYETGRTLAAANFSIIAGMEIPAPDFELWGGTGDKPWLAGLNRGIEALAGADTFTSETIASLASLDGDVFSPEPSVSTDKDDYQPGDTATITASGFGVGATVTFEVDHVSDPGADGIYGTADDVISETGGDGHDTWTVTDGGAGDLDGVANGTIVTEWEVNADDSADAQFLISASDGTDTAYNTFTDAIPTDADVDLTAGGTEATFNGVIFSNDAAPAGTGLINSFVRISSNDLVIEGYNTSDRPLEFDENNSPQFTRDLLFGDIPQVEINGITYLEFQLDINENNDGSANFLSLDEIEIYVSDAQIVAGTYDSIDFGATATKVYELDDGGDFWIALDYSLQAGSGVNDMVMFVPLSFFGDAEDDDFVTLYSLFGLQSTETDGGITYEWSQSDGF